MQPLSGHPRDRGAQPPLRRHAAVPVEARLTSGSRPEDVFSAPDRMPPATPPRAAAVQAGPALHYGSPGHAARPAPGDPRHRPAPQWPGADVGLAPDMPEPLLDSIPAIPSALQNWPGEAPRESLAPPPVPRRAARPRRDPSPSRLAYRLNRLWLTPYVRRGVKLGLPLLALALLLGAVFGDDERRAAMAATLSELRAGFENRPEFQVTRLSVRAETPEVAVAVQERLGLALPVSSFRLDLEALRRQAEALDAVESVALRIRSGGELEVAVLERLPVMVWRHAGGLDLVDAAGHRVARLASRNARPDLPLIAGEGAPAAIAEAQQILAAAAPLQGRLRGLVRVGQRRWDLVLERDQRILLPATGAVAALERVLALDAAQDLLARDVIAVDLRDPARPAIRLSQAATAELHRIRLQETGVRNR